MKHRRTLIAALAALIPIAASAAGNLDGTADELARRSIIVDTHIDVPYRLNENWEDVTDRTENGEFDYVRAREGGLDVPFMSIYTPAESEAEGTSYQLANIFRQNENITREVIAFRFIRYIIISYLKDRVQIIYHHVLRLRNSRKKERKEQICSR